MKGANEVANEYEKLFRMPKFKKLKARGWESERNFIYGKYNNYNFTVFQGSGHKRIMMPLKGISQPEIEIIQSFLSNKSKEFNLKNYFFEEEVLHINISEHVLPLSGTKLENILEEFTTFLNLSNINLQNRCIFCGGNNAYEGILKANILCETHEKCYIEENNKFTVEGDNLISQNKNYFRGIIGAILGGGIVAILNFLFIVFLDRSMIFIGVFIAVGASEGYEFLGGVLNKRTKYIVIFSTIFSTIFSVIFMHIMTYVFYMIGAGIPFNIENCIYLITLSESYSLIVVDALKDLFMSILGIVGIIRGIDAEIKDLSSKLKKVSL